MRLIELTENLFVNMDWIISIEIICSDVNAKNVRIPSKAKVRMHDGSTHTISVTLQEKQFEELLAVIKDEQSLTRKGITT